jgi:hypothetical protein
MSSDYIIGCDHVTYGNVHEDEVGPAMYCIYCILSGIISSPDTPAYSAV